MHIYTPSTQICTHDQELNECVGGCVIFRSPTSPLSFSPPLCACPCFLPSPRHHTRGYNYLPFSPSSPLYLSAITHCFRPLFSSVIIEFRSWCDCYCASWVVVVEVVVNGGGCGGVEWWVMVDCADCGGGYSGGLCWWEVVEVTKSRRGSFFRFPFARTVQSFAFSLFPKLVC